MKNDFTDEPLENWSVAPPLYFEDAEASSKNRYSAHITNTFVRYEYCR
jgi:hypothetical protein